MEFRITIEEPYKGKPVKFTSHRNKLCKNCKGTEGGVGLNQRTSQSVKDMAR